MVVNIFGNREIHSAPSSILAGKLQGNRRCLLSTIINPTSCDVSSTSSGTHPGLVSGINYNTRELAGSYGCAWGPSKRRSFFVQGFKVRVTRTISIRSGGFVGSKGLKAGDISISSLYSEGTDWPSADGWDWTWGRVPQSVRHVPKKLNYPERVCERLPYPTGFESVFVRSALTAVITVDFKCTSNSPRVRIKSILFICHIIHSNHSIIFIQNIIIIKMCSVPDWYWDLGNCKG